MKANTVRVFAAYLIDTGNPAVSFGFGPQLTAPTASKGKLGSEKWSVGFANVLFREDVNTEAFQTFAFYQLGGGTYLRAAPIWVYNFKSDDYSVPLGVGVCQVIIGVRGLHRSNLSNKERIRCS